MDPARWEHGSDFPLSLETGTFEAPWVGRAHVLTGSGRDAIRLLLGWGKRARGWTRLLVPSFFCQDVLRSLAEELPLQVYADAPDAALPSSIDADAKDAVLVTSFYGMRASLAVETRGAVIEDHTHDPLARAAFESRAAYAVASLRKTFPLPDGGVAWSPRGDPLPEAPQMTEAHAVAALDRLSGMVLKLHYLQGDAVEKDAFRRPAVAGEQRIGLGSPSAISPYARERLPTLPSREWREQRAKNLAAFRAALGDVPGVRLLDAPFAATLVCASHELRERLRTTLIARRIYPAVLWDLGAPVAPGIPDAHVDLARRVLSLHCDFRYDEDDMERVAREVRDAIRR
jgi:hypothetical protein